jgi:hypothetical protein
MPYLVTGTDRKTGRPTQFMSAVSAEALARMSADVRGIDVESCTFVPDPTANGSAGAPMDNEPVELTAPPTSPEPREWRLVEPRTESSPARRWVGLACAALGLCLAVFYASDLHAALAIRQEAQLSRRVLGAHVRSDYELLFGNNPAVNLSTQETLAATKTRIRVDGFLTLLGGVLVVGGLGMYKSNGCPSRNDVD